MARIYTPTQVLTTSPVGQLRLIQNAFNDLKSGTVREITEHVVKGGLVTKQDPTRVVMFYMIHLSKMKKVKEITEDEAKITKTTEVKITKGNGSVKLTKVVSAKKSSPKNTATQKSSPKTATR